MFDNLRSRIEKRFSSKYSIRDSGLVAVEQNLISDTLDQVRNEKDITPYVTSSDFIQMNTTMKMPESRVSLPINVVSDYYFYRMERFWETDGIVFRGVNKLVEYITNSGFTLSADSEKDVEKLKASLNIIHNTAPTDNGFDSWLRGQIHLLVLYGNVFFSKKLDNNRITRIKSYDPLSMSVVINQITREILYYASKNIIRKRGDIEKFVQQSIYKSKYYNEYSKYAPKSYVAPVSNEFTKISNELISHTKYLDLTQTAMSIPPTYTAMDDIMSLRSIENNILLLSYQYGHPLLHASIQREGLTNDEIRNESHTIGELFRNMKGNGMFVSSDRVNLKMIAAEGQLPNLVEFHEVFRKRAEKALGVPDVLTGEGGGAGRQTAETVSASFFSYVDHIAGALQVSLQNYVNEVWNRNILQRSDSYARDICPVTIKFNSSNKQAETTKRNQIMSQYTGGLITHDEARKQMGMRVDPKYKGKYFHEIVGNSKSQSGEEGKVNSQISPTNQHGGGFTQGTKKN